MPRKLIDLIAAGDQLGVHPRTVRRWIAEGRIEGYRVGRHIKVEQSDIDAFATPISSYGPRG